MLIVITIVKLSMGDSCAVCLITYKIDNEEYSTFSTLTDDYVVQGRPKK